MKYGYIELRMKTRMQEPLYRLIALQVLCNDGGYIPRSHLAIPGIVWHHLHCWARATLPQTFTARNEGTLGLILLKSSQHLIRPTP